MYEIHTEDLLYSSSELLGHRHGAHEPGDLDDRFKGQITIVLKINQKRE